MSPSVEPFDEAKYKALMDGLECSEQYYTETKNNKDFRIDSQFYTTKIRRNNQLSYSPIGAYLISSQYGVSKDMNTDGIGYPIFRMNEIHNSLCDLTTDKFVELTNDEFISVRLDDGDVLFNRTNSFDLVGRTGVYYGSGIPQTFASYLVRFVPDNKIIYSEYLAAFLNTFYGVQEIRRRARQSINQTNVNPEEVKAIEIPLLRTEFQEIIKMCYKKAHKIRIDASKKYSIAEEIFAEAIGINRIRINEESITVQSLSSSFKATGRIDAEYYQPKYKDYTNALKATGTVSSSCNIYDHNYTPNKASDYRYIELTNVGNSGEVNDVSLQAGSALPTRARRLVKNGQVIVSSVEGSLQNCALITEEYDDALCSTGFYVLDSDSINSETLLVLFKSEVIQALMKQRCSGSIMAAISKDEFLAMPMPTIDEDIQKEIAAKVQESFKLRRKSKQLLDYAKQTVEMAIEQGEDVALEWLKSKEGEM